MTQNSQRDVTVSFFPILPGVHSIGNGITIKDTISGKEYSLNNLFQIYVK